MVTQITIIADSINEKSRIAASHDACETNYAAQTDDCDSNSFLSETTRIMPLPTSRLIHREQSTIALMDRRFKFDGLTDRKADRSCPDLRENRKAFWRYLCFVRIHRDYIPHIAGLVVAITHLRASSGRKEHLASNSELDQRHAQR